ncbi:MAG: 6-pyruvoyl tetrahydropterin synthase family protein [Planctomycetaceae bacterium]|nr:6-pyruvoyl tetrahydropterin synthase family protein [Planctomycetaceae bacterium]
MTEFQIRIASDDLVFSAAHFILWGSAACEHLHGHSYRVAAELSGPLDEHQCVVDFTVVRDALKQIVAELDHRVLLPTQHEALKVSCGDRQVEVSLADRRWSFPRDNCRLLPIANTTTELFARYVGERLQERLAGRGVTGVSVRIEIGEGTGASAVCCLPDSSELKQPEADSPRD